MKVAAPLRVCWDWRWPPAAGTDVPGGAVAGRLVLAVADELARAQVLLLEIGYPSLAEVQGGLLKSVLDRVAAQVSVVLGPGEAGPEAAAALQRLGVAEAWADVTPGEGAGGGVVPLPRGGDGALWPALRIYISSSNVAEAAALVAEAAEGGVRKFSLPILPLFGRFLASAGRCLPSWKDLMEFAGRLEPLLQRFPEMDLRVHYQALWLQLKSRGFKAADGEAPGHSGCQAASALAYIDPQGVVYPCAALPFPLGRVDAGFPELWRGAELRGLRSAVEEVPGECGKCGLWTDCRGGCRGWSYYLTGSWGEPGPDCGLTGGAEGAPK